MNKFLFPAQYLNHQRVYCQLYDLTICGELSPWFETSSGVRQCCVVAPELFLEPVDWITNRAAHKGFLGVTVGEDIGTDLDYVDDVSLLASMLEILVLALEILHEESSQILS